MVAVNFPELSLLFSICRGEELRVGDSENLGRSRLWDLAGELAGAIFLIVDAGADV